MTILKYCRLAVAGNKPAFARPRCVGTPNRIDRSRFLARVNAALARAVLTNNGPYVQEFEKAVAAAAGVRHCVAVRSASAGLQMAARVLDLSGEVIIPSFTFIATAHALEWLGIRPVFADVELASHTLDPADVERRITPRTTGIIGVHVWGRSCDTAALTALARRHRLKLLFDAAHAFGCAHDRRPIGGFGDAEVFSFHATKFVSALEGGAVVTNDDGLADRLRLVRNFGFADYDRVVCAGMNGKMDEISAAMGLTSLEAMESTLVANRANEQAYRAGLAGLPGLRVLGAPKRERCNHQYVVVEVDDMRAGLTRDELMHTLWAENVLVRRYFYPGCHRAAPYNARPDAVPLLPTTEHLVGRILQLPTGTATTPDDAGTICQLLRTALENAALVRRLLRTRERLAPVLGPARGETRRAG